MDDVQGKGKGKITTMTKTETKAKCKAARQEPADTTIPDNEDSSSGPDTDSSVYKSELFDKNDPHKYIKASHVRAQAEAAPMERTKIPGTNRRSTYPKNFGKGKDGKAMEPLLRSEAPRKEFPLVLGTNEPYPGHGPPGPLRVLRDGNKNFDVIYHSGPPSGILQKEDMKLSTYIPARKKK
ncbi:hypothetical protein F4821DRAFT_261005 [Hypoxylon rubiginosum]|uniref:Uncharacterized protein n=1 Tax=Hypoxylon rubiginosum TaxID=110542 RepID=A0ACC0CY65_9PEZI|nr:hypothetical protein F4821DRAFT_261005 [Hypoxylon rubiginosum]